MKFPIFLAIVMAVFPTIEVQGNEDQGANNRMKWFGEKMEEVLVDINNERTRVGKGTVTIGSELKKGMLNSANLRDLLKNDYNRNDPIRIVGNELSNKLSYQVEVKLGGNAYNGLADFAGIYTLTMEKKNDKHVWVKQPSGHAIWSIKGEGWRIGYISEKNRNFDSTAFKSDGFRNDPTEDGQWKYKVRNIPYKKADRMEIRHLNTPTEKNERDLLFNDRPVLHQHVANFRRAFQALIDGTDNLVTCIETYNAYGKRPHDNYNCGDDLRGQPLTPCGGNKEEGRPVAIPNLEWLAVQLTNGKKGVQPIVKNWISANTLGELPNEKWLPKVSLTASGSHRGFAGGSLNTKDQRRDGYDLKAHFYLPKIPA